MVLTFEDFLGNGKQKDLTIKTESKGIIYLDYGSSRITLSLIVYIFWMCEYYFTLRNTLRSH